MFILAMVPVIAAGAFAMLADNPPAIVDDDEFIVWEPVYSTDSPVRTCRHSDAVSAPSVPDNVSASEQSAHHMILGEPMITDPDILCRFVRRHNADFPLEIAEAFLTVGRRYGIRGDIALCQAIIETGWFRFADGTAVKPEQHNYCGMGVTGRGQLGNSFATVEDGVTAHIQHLYAYACTSPLPKGEPLLDPRFKLVSRGVAPSWLDLSNRWAMNPNYGNQILKLYSQLLSSVK